MNAAEPTQRGCRCRNTPAGLGKSNTKLPVSQRVSQGNLSSATSDVDSEALGVDELRRVTQPASTICAYPAKLFRTAGSRSLARQRERLSVAQLQLVEVRPCLSAHVPRLSACLCPVPLYLPSVPRLSIRLVLRLSICPSPAFVYPPLSLRLSIPRLPTAHVSLSCILLVMRLSICPCSTCI